MKSNTNFNMSKFLESILYESSRQPPVHRVVVTVTTILRGYGGFL
jgi:hypothetical protein